MWSAFRQMVGNTPAGWWSNDRILVVRHPSLLGIKGYHVFSGKASNTSCLS